MSETYIEQINAIFALMKINVEKHDNSADWELAWLMAEIEPAHSMIYGRFYRQNNPIVHSFEAKRDLLDMAQTLYQTMHQDGEKWHGAKFILHVDGRRKVDFRYDNFWTKLRKYLVGYYPARDGIDNIVWGGLELD